MAGETRLLRVVWAAGAFAALACAEQGAAQPGEPAGGRGAEAAAEDLLARIDGAILRKHLGQFWGAVLVARDGQVVLAKGYGIENDGLRPIDADTVMDIGSIAKQFTAAAVLRLEMDRKLSIDDPASKWFPDAGPRAEKVTLRHLMSHTSGQPNDTIQRLDFPDRDEAVRRFFLPSGRSRPGESFEYNNAGYVVLAAVIEKASGMEFTECVREAVFKPAGLAQTGFLDGVGVNVARGAARVVSRGPGAAARLSILQDGWGWGFKGCGGVLTTMNDLVKWDRALAAESVLDSAAKAKLFGEVKEGVALGWMVESIDDGKGTRTRQHHTGATRGFKAALSRLPAEREGQQGWLIAVMTNERGDPVEIEKLVISELFPMAASRAGSALHVGGLKLNQHGLANFEAGVGVRVGAAERDGGRTLTITHEQKDQSVTLATIRLNRAATARLVKDLRAAMAEQRESDQRSSAGLIATKPYTPRDGRIELPETAEVVVMPRYTGVGEGGRRIVDERVTLVVVDREAGFWPVIVKMDTETAKGMSQQLADGRRAE